VTGADQRIELKHRDLLQALRIYDAPKAVMGFGISTPEHVRIALREGAQGGISGSKIVSIIEEHIDDKDRMLKELKNFVEEMVSAAEHKQA
jgi:tryptophan synthase alpha chain